MSGPTEKMRWRILKEGWATEEELNIMSYDEASQLIASNSNKPRNRGTERWAKPRDMTPGFPVSKPVFDNSTALISYTKDLVVAGKTTEQAIAIIQQIREAFK